MSTRREGIAQKLPSHCQKTARHVFILRYVNSSRSCWQSIATAAGRPYFMVAVVVKKEVSLSYITLHYTRYDIAAGSPLYRMYLCAGVTGITTCALFLCPLLPFATLSPSKSSIETRDIVNCREWSVRFGYAATRRRRI